MTPEERHRIVNAATSKLKSNVPVRKTPVDELMDKAMKITVALRDHIHPILAAGGWQDKPALRELIMTLYLEAFTKAFDKEALVNLCAVLHTDFAMERIESNPWDGPAPDALSPK